MPSSTERHHSGPIWKFDITIGNLTGRIANVCNCVNGKLKQVMDPTLETEQNILNFYHLNSEIANPILRG